MEIHIGDAAGLVNLEIPQTRVFEGNAPTVLMYALPYEVPGITSPDHVHYIPAYAVAEFELLYGMTAEQAFEYSVLVRVSTMTAGFEPENDWRRFYAEVEAGQVEQAMRSLDISEKFCRSAMASAEVVSLAEGQETHALSNVVRCVGCGKDKPGIPSRAEASMAHTALDEYFSARDQAAKMTDKYLAKNRINKSGKGWNAVKQLCEETSEMRDHAQRMVFDRIIGTPVKNMLRGRAEKAGFSIRSF